MISKVSCHVTLKAGVMPAENQLCHHRNNLHFKAYYSYTAPITIVIIFYNITIMTVFILDQINVALVSIRYFFKKITNLRDPKVMNSTTNIYNIMYVFIY